MRLTRRLKRGGGKEQLKKLGIITDEELTLSQKDIEKAYRQQSKKVHPDRNKTDTKEVAERKFRELTDAKDALLRKLKNGRYHYTPSPRRPQAPQQPPQAQAQRPQAQRQPSGYNFGEFESRHANRDPAPGGPGPKFESPPRANNFTRSERATRATNFMHSGRDDTRRNPPIPESGDVFSKIRNLHLNAFGRQQHDELFGNPRNEKKSPDYDPNDDILDLRNRRRR